MFALNIILARYLFVFYIAYFLLQGALYILDERGIMEINGVLCVSKQRVATVFMHLTGFLILAYVPGAFTFDILTLAVGAAGLLFILLGHFAVDKAYAGSCPLIWNGVFFLLDAGLIIMTRLDKDLAKRQLLWFFVSFVAMLLIPLALKFIKKFEKLEYVYLMTAFGLLVSPFFFGERIFGALNWIQIGSIQFQPSELVKFLYIFYLASAFRKKLSFKQILFPTAVSAVFVCILVYQRDLGGALIFFISFMAVLYISTGNIGLVALGFLGFSGASAAAYHVFPHIQTRVSAWLNPFADIYGGGHQIAHALFAIGTWGIFGAGLTRGVPNTVPVAGSDFIFAAICEELGSFFGVGLIAVYLMIFYRGVHVALRCDRRYYSLLAAGFTTMLAFQTFLILGGVTKLIPLTGVTLPFVSYGGSSILVCVLMAGILQWVFMYNAAERPKKRKGAKMEKKSKGKEKKDAQSVSGGEA